MTEQIMLFFLLVLIGGCAGYFFRIVIALSKQRSIEQRTQHAIEEAEIRAKQIADKAEIRAEKILSDARQEAKELRDTATNLEKRLTKKEENLDTKESELQQKQEKLQSKTEELEKREAQCQEHETVLTDQIATIAKLSPEEAKTQLYNRLTQDYEADLLRHIQKLEHSNHEELERRAQDIVVTAIERYAGSAVQELATTTVLLESDDIKGKIIGKEGRNIRAFERITGVELVVDDTPGAIVISSFDPIRRQVAKIALENLIKDGRIQPAKVEEFVELARHDINRIIKKKGEEATYELGIVELDPRIVAILGRLHFRTSFGQNVLQHSIEMSHIAGMLAEEVGANVRIAKAGALVHDIGKAVDHELPGGHVKIGIRILEKFGADPRIIDAMKSHHNDVPHETLEAVIVQAADHISGGRPGARRDTVERYLKRLDELENVANSFAGVEKSFALQAGREIRVFVEPAKLSDLESKKLARAVAKKIEQELKYPGTIKVTVIRETRIIEFAQ